jgi:hypothetical protein
MSRNSPSVFIVEVAGLGVARHVRPSRRARDVADAVRLGGAAHLVAGAVVEDPGAVRVPDVAGRERGGHDELDVLVVGRHEDVDRRGRVGWLRLAALLDPPHRDPEQERVDEAVGLGEHQRYGDPPHRPGHR